MELTAEQILTDEIGLNEDDYMKNKRDNFVRLIEHYNNDEVDSLNEDLHKMRGDRDERRDKAESLDDCIREGIIDLNNIDTSQEESEIASDIQRIVKTLQSNL